MGTRFLHLACQGGGRFAPLSPLSVTPVLVHYPYVFCRRESLPFHQGIFKEDARYPVWTCSDPIFPDSRDPNRVRKNPAFIAKLLSHLAFQGGKLSPFAPVSYATACTSPVRFLLQAVAILSLSNCASRLCRRRPQETKAATRGCT